VHTPRFWGFPLMAGALLLYVTARRLFRTSWLIVGTLAPENYRIVMKMYRKTALQGTTFFD
jgi:hypothetical protein